MKKAAGFWQLSVLAKWIKMVNERSNAALVIALAGKGRIKPFEAGIHVEFDFDRLARVRLQKAQTIGLKHQAFFVVDKTVQRIVHDRIADVGQMNADLVLASGGNVGRDERFVFKQFQTGDVGMGRFAFGRPSSFSAS